MRKYFLHKRILKDPKLGYNILKACLSPLMDFFYNLHILLEKISDSKP